MVNKYGNPKTVLFAYRFSQPDPTRRIRGHVVCRNISSFQRKTINLSKNNTIPIEKEHFIVFR